MIFRRESKGCCITLKKLITFIHPCDTDCVLVQSYSDFLEKAHEMWQQDKQEDEESEDQEGEVDYLPPLPAFKITSKNRHTYLGASVFLVKEFQQEIETSSRKRKVRDTPVTDD